MNLLNCPLFFAISLLLFAQTAIPFAYLPVSNPRLRQAHLSRNSTDELVKQLLTAESDVERQTILTKNQQIISHQLIEVLINLKKVNPVLSDEKIEKIESLNRMILGLSERINYQKGIAASICYLGAIHRRNLKYDLALRYYDSSLPQFRTLNEKSWLARVHRYIGRVHFDQQNYFEALKHYAEECQLAKELHENYYVALALYNLGSAYQETEQLNKAIELFRESLKFSLAITNPPPDVDLSGLITDTLDRVGKSYFANRQFDQAIDAYKQKFDKLLPAKDFNKLAEVLSSLGYAYFESGNYNEALKFSLECLAMAEKTKARSFIILSNIAIALINSNEKNHSLSIEAIEKAKITANSFQDKTLLQKVYRAEGIVNYMAGNQLEAHAAFDRVIKLIEEQRARIPINSESGPVSLGYQYSPYGWMTALLVSQGKFEEALHYAERSKSRFLYNLLGDPTGKNYRLPVQTNLEEQQRLVNQYFNLDLQLAREEYSASPNNGRIASLKSEIQTINEALITIRKKIVSDSAEIAKRWPQESKLTRQDLAALLPDEQSALLQFAMSEEQAFLFVATKTQANVNLQAYPLKIRKQQIRDGVAQFRDLIINQDQSQDLNRAAREWHDKLLGSAQRQLENIRSYIIVPDGPLWEMPFQALKGADNHYLIESHAITYAPSFNVLRRMSQPIARSAPDLRLLAFGNPALLPRKKLVTPGGLMDTGLDPLPDAERQVNWLRRQYGQKNSKVLIRDFATEASFKKLAPQYGILHLAAHGLYNDLDPMRSSIVLSQTGNSPGEDGFLEAREITRLRLNADLAILSACETGRGQVRDGEGIIGLPYALFVAGCPTTVVSQWKVNDKSTADLMVALHTKFNQNRRQVSKAEALRQAAVSLISGPRTDFRHPFYWAGFIVFGKSD